MINILLIEDDLDYANYFCGYMEQKGIQIKHVSELNLENLKNIEEDPKLIILDFFFGDNNSLEIYSFLKERNIPIMYLTSNTDSEIEEKLLKQGVIDYVDKLKPLSIIELKIRKVVDSPKLEYQFYGNTLDMETRKINDKCKLTENEYKIILCLVNNIGNYVLAQEIMVELWDDNIFIEKNTLVVAIKRIRDKFKKYEFNIGIESKKGKGYRLNEF